MKYTDLTSALQGRAAAEHQIHAAEVSEKNAAFEERKRKFQALKHEVEETYTARVGALVNAISLAAKTNFEAGYELIPWLPLSELMIAEYPNRADAGRHFAYRRDCVENLRRGDRLFLFFSFRRAHQEGRFCLSLRTDRRSGREAAGSGTSSVQRLFSAV